MAAGSKRVIYAALIGNALIAVTKFIAASITGSSAMISEGIHSCVDTGNQVLLLYGMRRARRQPDEQHPFGYGAEMYFWAFVVAILIFAVGAGLSLYEGFEKLQHPEEVTSPVVNYVVLGLAIVIEGFAWATAYRAFNTTRGGLGWIEAVRRSKDPAVFTVLFEDTAAMLGLVVALVGLFIAEQFDLPIMDGVASIIIGIILAVTAVLLAMETKGLLIGEGADAETVLAIRRVAAAVPVVRSVNEVLTLYRGPQEAILALSLDFENNLTAGKVEEATAELEAALRLNFPAFKRIFVEAQSQEDHADEMARFGGEFAGTSG